MEGVREKIKTSSLAVAVVLLAGASILAVSAIVAAGHGISSASIDLASPSNLEPFVEFGMFAALAALLVFVALTFLRISREETPFFPGLSRRVKIAAPWLFLAVALPRWIGFATISIARGVPSGAIFDEFNIPFLIAAVVLLCFGQILEYGWQLQDESYEII